MALNFITLFNYFIIFVIIVKIIYILASLGHLLLQHNGNNPDLDKKMYAIKKQSEFVFVACMAVLLIYHFNPNSGNKPVSKEISILFFLFGWILILTAEWKNFFNMSPFFKKVADKLK